MFLFSIHFISDFVKRMFSVPAKSRRPMVAPTNLFFIATTPSLRDTSPQGEAFRLPLWGAVGNANCGVAMLFLLSPPLRHFVTPLLKERLFGSHREELSVMPTVVWLCYFYFRHYSVTSRHLSSRRGSLAPIEGSCQHS